MKKKKVKIKSKSSSRPKLKLKMVIENKLSVGGKRDSVLARIKVVGIGGGGGNAVSRMYEEFPRGIDLITINTDIQDLNNSNAKKRVYIGKNLTRGLGTGMNPELGKQAAEESRSEIVEAVRDADIVFITAGMGGGTGTGAAPIVAEIAKELNILTIAIVTKPFTFEGGQRQRIAEEGLIKLRDRVDTLITIPNDKIFSIINKDTSLIKAFEEVDRVLKDSVKGIAELILTPGIINIDFADIKTVMRDAGSAMVGIGIASGQGRASKAAMAAVNSPLLETSIDGVKGLLFSVSGRNDLKMQEINEIATAISEKADGSAKIIFGTYYDRKLSKGQLKITLIAAGFSDLLVREARFHSNLFVSDEEIILKNHSLPFEEKKNETEIIKPEEKIGKKNEKKAIMDEEKNWDIPAFLRRKKK
ncbi:MAG: cell division protein FtsZ [Patescibacteria group bacterium]|nr:cell division protein FtsZ [Patescibacteria group bacterium]